MKRINWGYVQEYIDFGNKYISLRDIAKRFNIAISSVSRARKLGYISFKITEYSPRYVDATEVIRLYKEENYSVEKIAEKMNFKVRTIKRCLRRYGHIAGRRARTRICPVCNKKFKIRYRKQKHCSRNCAFLMRGIKRRKEILSGKIVSTRRIKRFLEEESGHRCMLCGVAEWNREYLPLILDHINGNSEDNRLENVRLICSNCDSQLPTYKSKNKNSSRKHRKKYYDQYKRES